MTLGRPRSGARPGPGIDSIRYWEYAPWVAILMLAFIGIRLHEVIPALGNIRPVLLTVVLGMGPLLMKSGPAALRSVLDYPVTKIIVAYFLWVAVTVPFAMWQRLAFEVWMGLIAPILMFLAVLLCTPTRKNLEKIVWGTVAATALYLVLNIASGLPEGGGWRLGSEGAYDPNDIAALVAVVLPLSAGLFFRYRGFPKALALAASIVLVAGLVQTGSRGGLLAAGAGVMVFALGHRGFRLFAVLFAVTVGGVVAWQSSSVEFRERMMTLTALGDDYNTQSEVGRIQVWKRGASYFIEHPVLGVGAGNFSEAEGRWLLSQNRSGKWSVSHNAYIQAAAELGAIGGLLFLALIASATIRAKRMWRVKKSRKIRQALMRPEMLGSTCAVATAAVFLSMAYSWVLFAVMALVGLADRVNMAETAPRPPSRFPGKIGAVPVGSMAPASRVSR